MGSNNTIKKWWIGGGYDLTPYLPFKDDCINWHKEAKETLDQYNKTFYKKFSKNCNEYFYIPHRKERRGIGGLFFDNITNMTIEKSTDMLSDLANTYLESYQSIVSKRKASKFSKEQKEFQLLRRGRYAEFNLIYDRGTAFGLQSNGRIESILASLPKDVKWSYKKDKNYIKLEKEVLKYIGKDWNV